MSNLVSAEVIATKILIIRGKRVMLDSDLAVLYEVKTKRLNEQVARNINRFPEDFMFQLRKGEIDFLRSHFATSKQGGRRYLPYVFTQEGVAMLSSVLNSERAVQVNIQIMRAFVKLRYILSANKQFEMKLRELEDRVGIYDKDIRDIFEAIRQLIGIPNEKNQRFYVEIGFVPYRFSRSKRPRVLTRGASRQTWLEASPCHPRISISSKLTRSLPPRPSKSQPSQPLNVVFWVDKIFRRGRITSISRLWFAPSSQFEGRFLE